MFTFFVSAIFTTITVFSANVTIETLLGNVIGQQKDGFVEFKGIPFVENQPIGNYRLTQANLRTSPYSMDPFPALSFGPSCIQYNPWDPTIGELSEDCLYINIYTPSSFDIINGSLSSTGELLPVMVWIYGGAFAVGSSSQYSPDAFMRNQNLILVTFNYRVGPLGFLSLRSIYDETNGRTTGGMNGLNDQIVALQWIQNYIEDYGGDPDRVTVFGESAGGFSGCFLSLIPKAAGLVDQIVIQSGLCAPPYAEPQPFETGIASSIGALSYVGLGDNITAIRAADVSVFFTIGYFVQPAVDGYLLKDTAFNMLETNNFTINANKIIIGTVSLDTTILWPWFASAVPNPTNEREFNGYLEQYITNETQQDLIKNTYYPLSDFPPAMYDGGNPNMIQEFSNYTMRWGTITADCCWTCGALWYAKKLTQNKGKTGFDELYVYHFIGPSDADYIPHGSDVGYIFYNDSNAETVDFEYLGVPKDKEFIAKFQDIWHNFAIYNDPNSSRVIEQWLPYDNETKSVYMIGTDSTINKGWYNVDDFLSSGYRNGACDFWIDDIGWDITSNLCLGIYSLPTTTSPTPEIIEIGDNVTITTQLADVIGIQNDGFVEFKGIPFVENQPTGDYRFTEAELKTTPYLFSPFPALSLGPSCIQAPDPTVGTQSEACLFVNIYTPNVSPDELLPVMVWIYGGGFATGSSTQYRPDAFMNDENVILVTFNYRIGALGFLSLESIYNETNGRTTGGMNGLNDQIVALQWVQNYISDYGGDPNQVTIFGESAGGFSSCFLSLIPKASGLFDQVIIQSGHCSPNWGTQNEYEAGIIASVTSLSYIGLTDNLTQIRAADASLFVPLFPQLSVDKYILYDTTQNMLLHNNYTLNGNRFIIGTVSLDTLLLYPYFVGLYPAPTTEMEFDQYLEQYIPDETQQDLVKNTYYPISDFPESIYYGDGNDPVTYSNYTMRWGTMSADVCWKCANLWYAQKLAENDIDRELYVYDFIGPPDTNYIPHGADVAYLFYNGTNETETASGFEYLGVTKDLEFSRLFQNVWINFGLYGRPNSSMLNEEWMPYDVTNRNGYILGNDGNGNENYNVENFYRDGYRNGACEFWIDDIGWDIMGYLCLNVYSLEPTASPTTTPSMEPTQSSGNPTINPTVNPTVNVAKDDQDESNDDATIWMIVAIIFIILFFFALIIIIYQCYSSSNKDEYSYSQPPKPSGFHEPVDSKDVTEMTGNGNGRTDGLKYDI